MDRKLALQSLNNDQLADRNLMEIEFHEKEEMLNRAAEEGTMELPAEQAMRDKKEEFKERLARAGSDRERKELLREQEQAVSEIQAQLEREAKN